MVERHPGSTVFPDAALFASEALDAVVTAVLEDVVQDPGEDAGVHQAAGQGDGGRGGSGAAHALQPKRPRRPDRKSTRLNSSHANISYAVFCLKKKTSRRLHS